MEENKKGLSIQELKNEYSSLSIIAQSLVLYAQIMATVENYEKANIAIKLAEPYRDRINTLIKEISARKENEEQDLA